MELETKNTKTPGIVLRFKALFYDWLLICVYLLLLSLIAISFYFVAFRGIPNFTNTQTQIIAALTSLVPVIIIFAVMEGPKSFASWGKKKAHIKVTYKGMAMKGSIIRNTLKFLPWQFGHMSTINGIYNDFNTPFSMIFFALSVTLSIVYILMALIRKDGRHLADILAGSSVVQNNDYRKS